jgi:DNA repair protein RecO (recombination protein O)
MNRQQLLHCIIVQSRKVQEDNVNVTLFSKELGLIHALVFGAAKPKSRKAGKVQLFLEGDFNLYFNPVKESWKLEDVSVKYYHESLSTDLTRYYTASLCCEIISKSYASHEPELFELLQETLRLLEIAAATKVPYVNLQFLIRFLEQQGVLPDFSTISGTGLYSFDGGQGRFVLGSSDPGIGIAAAKYVQHSLELNMEAALKLSLDIQSFLGFKMFMLTLLRTSLEQSYNSLDSGYDLLSAYDPGRSTYS